MLVCEAEVCPCAGCVGDCMGVWQGYVRQHVLCEAAHLLRLAEVCEPPGAPAAAPAHAWGRRAAMQGQGRAAGPSLIQSQPLGGIKRGAAARGWLRRLAVCYLEGPRAGGQ